MESRIPPEKQPPLLSFADVRSFLKQDSTLNVIVSAVVLLFICHQVRSLYTKRSRRKHQIKVEEEERARKLYIERGTMCQLDLVDQQFDLPADAPKAPYHWHRKDEEDSLRFSQLFYEQMKLRRSVCHFQDQAVPMKVVLNVIKTASTAPSIDNTQPWTFCVVGDGRMKCELRHIIETNEKHYFAEKKGAEWVQYMEQLQYNWDKPYLSEAPFLIVVCRQLFSRDDKGVPKASNGAEVSTTMATGFLIAAIHNAGLATVPTGVRKCDAAIRKVLKRPDNERVSFLLPIGYPADDATVTDFKRKPIEKIVQLY